MKASFTAEPSVLIRVEADDGAKDDRLVTRLLGWLVDEQIYPVRGGGRGAGPNFYAASYRPDDAERIVEWLRAHGATKNAPGG